MTQFTYKLFFTLLGVLFSANSIHAFSHKFYNATPFPATFTNFYSASSTDVFTLQPGEDKTINVGAAALSKSNAKIEVPIAMAGTSGLEGTDNTDFMNAKSYKGPYSGSASWAVVGPIKKKKRKDRSGAAVSIHEFRVTRLAID